MQLGVQSQTLIMDCKNTQACDTRQTTTNNQRNRLDVGALSLQYINNQDKHVRQSSSKVHCNAKLYLYVGKLKTKQVHASCLILQIGHEVTHLAAKQQI